MPISPTGDKLRVLTAERQNGANGTVRLNLPVWQTRYSHGLLIVSVGGFHLATQLAHTRDRVYLPVL